MFAVSLRFFPPRRIAAALALAGALACACAPSSNRGAGHPSTSVKKGPIGEVLAARTPELLRIPGVIGTGEGSEGGERVLVVFVSRRTAELDAKLPRELDGYKIVVREAGDVTAPPR